MRRRRRFPSNLRSGSLEDMSRNGRRSVFVLALVLALSAGFAVTALAAEEGEPEEGAPAEEETEVPADSGLTPAVEIGSDEAAPAQADWTYRYLIPTGLVLAVVIVLLTSIKYFTDVVRKRYRIVE